MTNQRLIEIPGYGKVECGKVSKASFQNARSVFQYIGIPFAQPPIGNLRFLPPVRAISWSGTLNNKEQQKVPMRNMETMETYFHFCPQKRSFYEKHCSEDCLYLNVFVPDAPYISKLPVMVWFYGGSFQVGPNVFFDATAIAGMNDVIVVVPNYRVNCFGFMTLGKDSACKGNLGLLDQLQALKWVRETIECFGGDKENVTIFGHSAGGISVNMHMMSPLSQGYFKKAISFSGTGDATKIYIEDQRRATEAFLRFLKIDDKDSDVILKKLQALSSETILNADIELNKMQFTWFPTLDGYFLLDSPMRLLRHGCFSKIPYMLGCTNSEGGYLMNMGIPSYLNGVDENVYKRFGTGMLKWFDRAIDAKKALPLLKNIYNEKYSPVDNLQFTRVVAGIMGDTTFNVGITKTAQTHADSGSPTYFYNMKHQPLYSHSNVYGPPKARKPDFIGADHGDDVHYFWGAPFVPACLNEGFSFSEEEKEMSRNMMTYITNFAKTGNPNKGSPVDLHWPKYSKKEGRHIVFSTPVSVDSSFGVEKLYLFSNVLPKL